MAITEAVPVATTDGRLSRAAGRVRSSAIRDLLALTESAGVLSLAGGLPAVGHVHDPVLAEATARVLADPGAAHAGAGVPAPALPVAAG
jgi:hypothetical protein